MENRGTITTTGKECPYTGYWESVCENGRKFFFKSGQLMPTYGKEDVYWVLTQEKMDE